MRINKWLIIIASIFLVLVLVSKFVTRVFTKNIKLNASLETTNESLGNLNKIIKWYPIYLDVDTSKLKISNTTPLTISTTNNTLQVHKKSGLEFVYLLNQNRTNTNYIYRISSDTTNYTSVLLQYESSIWDKIFGTNKQNKNAIASLEKLKEFAEDNKNIYGYKIERSKVVDTLFLFTSKKILTNNKKIEIKKLYEKLITTATTNNLGYNNTRIFYENILEKGKSTIYCSIGINKTTATNSLPLECCIKKMPKYGNLIFAYYQGTFKEIGKAYQAVDKFKNDNHHVSMAIPFTKFLTEGILFDDNQVIQAEVYHPVF